MMTKERVTEGDWVVCVVRNGDELLSVTGVVTDACDGLVTFRSDGGQKGFPRGARKVVPEGAVSLSDSPHAPHRRRL